MGRAPMTRLIFGADNAGHRKRPPVTMLMFAADAEGDLGGVQNGRSFTWGKTSAT